MPHLPGFGFDLQDENMEVWAAVNTRSQRLQQALIDKLNDLDTRLMERIQMEKLMGQVLHYRSGTLFRSVQVVPAEATASGVMGGVESSGGPAFYGKVHEEGRSPAWVVPAFDKKVLHFLVNGEWIFRKQALVGRHTGGMPQRSFMQSAQKEMEPTFIAEIQAVAKSVLSAQPRDAKGRFTTYQS